MKQFYKFILFISWLFVAQAVVAQSSYYWAKTVAGSTSVIDLATDSAGNAYTISSGAGTRYIKKYNIKGDLLWTNTYAVNGTVGSVVFNAIEVAPNGTVFVAGSANTPGDYQIDLGTATAGKINTGNEEAGLVLSLNTNGDFSWAKSIHGSVSGTTPTSYFNDLTLLGNSVFACGSFNGTVGSLTALNGEWLVVPFAQTNGSFSSIRTYATTATATASPNGAVATTIKSTGTSFVIAGNYRPTNTSTPYNAFLLKISGVGEVAFFRTWGGTGIDKVSDIDVSGDTIVTVGTFEGSFTYSGTNTTHTSAGSSDIFIIRSITTATPSEVVKTIGNATEDRATKVQLIDKKIYLTGSFQGTLDINPSTATTTELTSGGGFDAFAMNFASNISNTSFGTIGTTGIVVAEGAGVGHGLAMAVCKKELLIGGSFNGLTDFNPTATANTLTSSSQVGFLAKYGSGCATPLAPSVVIGPAALCNGNVGTYSSSSINATYYEWTLPANWTGTSFSTQIQVTAGTGAGVVSVKAYNSCGAASAARNLTVYQLPMSPTTLTGPTELCIYNNRLVPFSHNTAAAATSYLWKVPSNWGLAVLERTTTSVSLTQKTGTGTRISVKGKNACGLSVDSAFLDVNVHSGFPVGATPTLSSGAVTSCVGSAISLSVPVVQYATVYSWNITNANDNFVINTSTPSLNYNSTKAGQYTATVKYLNADTACNHYFAPTNKLSLTFQAPATIGPYTITGETLGIEQHPYTYITSTGGSDINVFRKNGITESNATFNSASISFSPGQNVVSLRKQNLCGLGPDSAKLNVTILPYRPQVVSYSPVSGSINVMANPTFTITFDRSVNKQAGQTFTLYNYNTNQPIQILNVINAVSSGNNIAFTFPTALTTNTKYYISSSPAPVLDANNWPNGRQTSEAIGGKEVWNFTVGVITGMEDATSENTGMNVMPNPAENALTIQTEGLISAELYDLAGVQVAKETSSTMDISDLASGVYILNVKSTNGNFRKQIVKK